MLTDNEFKDLQKINPLRTYMDIALCWAMIGGSLYLWHLNSYFLPLTIIVTASRLHALVIIMHDGAHSLISKNKFINDAVSNIFCAFPLQLSTEAYRQSHYKHHKHTQTWEDPNFVIMQNEQAWHFPKPKEEVKKILIRDLLLLTMKEHMIILKGWQVMPNYKTITKSERVMFPLFMLSVLALVTYFHVWPEFLIMQLSSLFINPIVRIRAMSEHTHEHSHGQSKIHKYQETPTINASWVERFLISPLNTNRHLEHHTYPTIPYYNLEKAHTLMKKTELYKQNCLYELDGYFLGKRNSFTELLCEKEMQPIKKAA